MQTTAYTDVTAFLPIARPFVEADSVRHTVVLTTLRYLEDVGKATAMVTVHRDDDPDDLYGLLAGQGSAPASTSALPADAATPAAEALAANGATLPGVRGPVPDTEAFAHAWTNAGDNAGTVEAGIPTRRWLYRLGTLAQPIGVRGEARLAGHDDLPRLAAWREAFGAEALLLDRGAEYSSEAAIARVLDSGGWYGVWCVAGEPVAMALAGAPTAGTSRIGHVYTPPEQRGHGYAAALTASVSRWARDAGVANVVLFADAANPVSNRIYQRIGYEKLFENIEVPFASKGRRRLES